MKKVSYVRKKGSEDIDVHQYRYYRIFYSEINETFIYYAVQYKYRGRKTSKKFLGDKYGFKYNDKRIPNKSN